MTGGGGSQTTRTEPFEPARPSLGRSLAAANDIFNRDPFTLNGPQTIGFTPTQIAGQNAITDVASGPLSNFTTETLAANQGLATGNSISPFASQVADANAQQIGDQFNRFILPGIRSNAVQAGQVGGSREGIAQGLAAEGAARAIADSTSALNNQQFGQSLQAQLQAQSLAPRLAATSLLPGEALNQVGLTQQQQQIQEFDDLNFQNEFNFNADQRALTQFQNNINPVAFGLPSTVAPTQRRNRAGGALGGAVAGAQLGSIVPGLGTAVGAIGGGLLGAFG